MTNVGRSVADKHVDITKTRVVERRGKVTNIDTVWGAFCNPCDDFISDGLRSRQEAEQSVVEHSHLQQLSRSQ